MYILAYFQNCKSPTFCTMYWNGLKIVNKLNFKNKVIKDKIKQISSIPSVGPSLKSFDGIYLSGFLRKVVLKLITWFS